jgi:hypothetical protein
MAGSSVEMMVELKVEMMVEMRVEMMAASKVVTRESMMAA